jgi:hypothetical protein
MKSNKAFFFLLIMFLMAGCGGGGGGGGGIILPPAKTLVSIAVTPANTSIALGATQQFVATGTFSDKSTQDISSSVTWTSLNAGVAKISATGLSTAVATGTTTITAGSGAVSGTAKLTVTTTALVSIAVTPANPTVAIETTQQFTATGTLLDNTTQDFTTLVTWNSSNSRVATIDATGIATSHAAGTSTISATIGSIAGSTTMMIPVPSGGNVLSVTVNGSLCSSTFNATYPNKPCVSVTVCVPGTSTCQTVNDILLDTGSSGLRIFKTVLNNLSLPQVTVPGGNLAECVQFADGSADWGPVQTANVVLGGEPSVTVPIQVIDSTFGTVPTACGTPEASPSAAGLNGILGVGLFVEDCGAECVSGANNGRYYACSGSSCSGTTVDLTSQVRNPVASLPADNNGVLLLLPGINTGGAPSVDGYLVLGIGTQTNNTPTTEVKYPASPTGEFTTTFNGSTYSDSFIDSGSNALFFSDPALPISSGGWYIPASTTNLSATTEGFTGTPSGVVPFQIGNATSLFSTGNNVFTELGARLPGVGGFDWGLPFFFGRPVFIGIEGKSSSLGSGPYWAY